MKVIQFNKYWINLIIVIVVLPCLGRGFVTINDFSFESITIDDASFIDSPFRSSSSVSEVVATDDSLFGNNDGSLEDISVNSKITENNGGTPINSSEPADEEIINVNSVDVTSTLPESEIDVSPTTTTIELSSGDPVSTLPSHSNVRTTPIHKDIHLLTPEDPKFSIKFNLLSNRFLAIDGASWSNTFEVKYSVIDPSLQVLADENSVRNDPFHFFTFGPIDGEWNVTIELIGTGDTNATLSIVTEAAGVFEIDDSNPHHRQYGLIEAGLAEYYLIETSYDYFTYSFSSSSMYFKVYTNTNGTYDISGAGEDSGHVVTNVEGVWIIALYNSKYDDVYRSITIPEAYLATLDPSDDVFMSPDDKYEVTFDIESEVAIFSLDISGSSWYSISSGTYSGYVDMWGVLANGTILFSKYFNTYSYNFYFTFTNKNTDSLDSITVILVGDVSETTFLSFITSASSIDDKSFGSNFNIDFPSTGESYYFTVTDPNLVTWALLYAISNSSYKVIIEARDFNNPDDLVFSLSSSSSYDHYSLRSSISESKWLIIVTSGANNLRATINLLSDIGSSLTTEGQNKISFLTSDFLFFKVIPTVVNSFVSVVNENSYDIDFFILNSSGIMTRGTYYLTSLRSRSINYFSQEDLSSEFYLFLKGEKNAACILDIRTGGTRDKIVNSDEKIRPVIVDNQEPVVISYTKNSSFNAILTTSANSSVDILLLVYSNASYLTSYYIDYDSLDYLTLTGLKGTVYDLFVIGYASDSLSITIFETDDYIESSIPFRKNYLLHNNGDYLALFFNGPISNSNTTFLTVGLNDGSKLRLVCWDPFTDNRKSYSLTSYYNRYIKCFDNDTGYNFIFVLLFGVEGINLTITMLNTGCPTFEVSNPNVFQSVYNGGLELWHVTTESALAFLSMCSSASLVVNLYLTSQSSYISSLHLSGQVVTDIVDVSSYDELFIFVEANKYTTPCYWSFSFSGNVSSFGVQENITSTTKGELLVLIYNLDKYAGRIEFNTSFTSSSYSKLYIHIYNTNLDLAISTYVTETYRDDYSYFTTPAIGIYYVVLVVADSLNATVNVNTKAAQKLSLGITLHFIDPEPSKIIMRNNVTQIEPRYSDLITIRIQVDDFPGNYLTKVYFSSDNGSSWLKMSFEGVNDTYIISWNTTEVKDGFTILTVYVTDNFGYAGIQSINIYVDNVIQSGEVNFYYDNDPPSIKLLNYNDGDYITHVDDFIIVLVVSVTDPSGVNSTQYSLNNSDWYSMTSNDTGLYNIFWSVDLELTTNRIYIRSNDTRNNTGTLTIVLSTLNSTESNDYINLYLPLRPIAILGSFGYNITFISDDCIDVFFEIDIFDANGIKGSKIAYNVDTYSYSPYVNPFDWDNIYPVENFVHLNQTVSVDYGDFSCYFSFSAINVLDYEVNVSGTIIVDILPPIVTFKPATYYRTENSLTVFDYGYGIKNVVIRDDNNGSNYTVFYESENPGYNSSYYFSGLSNGSSSITTYKQSYSLTINDTSLSFSSDKITIFATDFLNQTSMLKATIYNYSSSSSYTGGEEGERGGGGEGEGREFLSVVVTVTLTSISIYIFRDNIKENIKKAMEKINKKPPE